MIIAGMMRLISIKSKLQSYFDAFLLAIQYSKLKRYLSYLNNKYVKGFFIFLLVSINTFILAKSFWLVFLIFYPVYFSNPLFSLLNNQVAQDNSWKWLNDQFNNSVASKREYIFPRLNIKLKGITYSSAGRSAAIIDSNTTVNQIILEKEELFGEIIVDKIFINSVRLTEADQTFLIELPPENGITNLSSTPRSNNSNTPPSSRTSVISQNPEVARIAAQLEEKPIDIFRYINIKQIIDNGSLSGVQLSLRREKELFEEIGFADQDIITHVNGTPIADYVRQNRDPYRIINSSEVTLTVLRDGASETFTVTR